MRLLLSTSFRNAGSSSEEKRLGISDLDDIIILFVVNLDPRLVELLEIGLEIGVVLDFDSRLLGLLSLLQIRPEEVAGETA
jgi:hypothetical protein